MRRTKLIIIIGYNGTGKSTYVQKIINLQERYNKRSLIITPHDVEWLNYDFIDIEKGKETRTYTGTKKYIYKDKNTLRNLSNHYRNGLLVFDDCRAYFNSNVDNELHSLFIARRQKMIDIIAVGHGFTEIPPKFFTFASEIILFKTMDNIDKRKNVLRNFEFMKQMQTKVNKAAETNPYHSEIIKML